MRPHDPHHDDQDTPPVTPHEPIHGVFTDLFEADMMPPNWVIKDLLPPGLVFLGAPPKAGKSTFELAISLLVAGYECRALPPFLSEVVNGGPVLGFSAEAAAGELRHIAEVGLKCKGDPKEAILICDDPFQWRLDDEDGMVRLMDWLAERKPKLVFIDPLRDFHALEEKDSGQMNRLLRPLQKWAKEHDSCVLVVHHTKKRGSDDARGGEAPALTPDDLRGTGALFGIADAVLMMTPAQDGFVRMIATFKRAKGWDRTFLVASYDHAGRHSAEKIGEVEKLVLRALQAGLTDVTSVGRQAHLTPQRVKEALEMLRRNGMALKGTSGWRQTVKKRSVSAKDAKSSRLRKKRRGQSKSTRPRSSQE